MSKVRVNNREYTIEVSGHNATVNGEMVKTNIHKIDNSTYHFLYNDKSISIKILDYHSDKNLLTLLVNDKLFETHIVSSLEETIQKMAISSGQNLTQLDIKSPMPGLIQKILCKEGQEIKQGDQLIILNAMKMENIIKASNDGIVNKICIKEEDQVEKGKVLIQF